jgi:hypothetical protein
MNRSPMTVAPPERMHGDAGVALPFIAVMLLVLLAFVAFAVDVGAAFAVRRQSQSAADTAVLGAAQEILDGGSRAGAASYAKELSFSTVAMHPTSTEWETDFSGCTDPGALAATAPSGGITSVWTGTGSTGCVSFSASNQRVRVRIPTQTVSAAFAQLVGVDTFEVSTSAEAVINFTSTGGGALPYAITGANGALLEVCLNNGAGNVPEPLCQGGTTGNFGALDWSIFGNASTTAWGTSGQTTIALSTVCSSSSSLYNASERLALNDMLGVDHPLSVVEPAASGTTYDASDVRNDRTLCNLSTPPNFLSRPNEAPTQTGNAVSAGTSDGLIDGFTLSNGFKLRARFDRFCGLGLGWSCVNLYNNGTNNRGASGSPIDNTPLWHFLSTDLTAGAPGASSRSDGSFKSVPSSCVPSTFASAPSKAKVLQCLQDYVVGGYGNVTDANGMKGTVLFGKDTDGDPLNGRVDIMAAPRFGFVPLLWNQTWPTGQSDPVQIKEFRPVYFQTMLLGCNANNCTGVHNPGESWSAINSNRSLDAISALAPSLTMLPLEAREIAPTGAKDLQITLVR